MSDQMWALFDSWHAVSDDGLRTLCGLDLTEQDPHELSETMPAGKSCENCLRDIEWRKEKAPA